jgi:aldehyde:ferredoxin oxidoreductase
MYFQVTMIAAKGPALTIDVSTQTTYRTEIADVLEQFIGGRGVATKLAHDEIPFDADPFGPENSLFFSTGPLQMSRMSFTGRMNLTGLSPMTNGLLSSNAGGYLSRNFAATGNSVVAITGKSEELIAIRVSDEGVAFEEVPQLSGATVPEVTAYMEDQHGLTEDHLAQIGPAGENRVRFASVMTSNSRAFGRGGLGAVMGSKNVKCIAFEGNATPDIDLPEDVQKTVHKEAAQADDLMKRRGTNDATEWIMENFSIPTRYFEKYAFDGIAGINGERIEEKKYKKGTCSTCAFACKLPTRDEESGIETEGPEFETVFSFGTNCEVDDIVSVMKSNQLCDELGLDTISAGNVVAAYLKAHDEFGNSGLIHELVRDIAHRDGDGDMLAEGIHRFHEALGVHDYTVKGLEFAAHDGRVLHGQGLSYAVANRGADHLYSVLLALEYGGDLKPEGLDGKARRLVTEENRMALRDSAVVCEFSRKYVPPDAFEALLDAEYDQLLDVGSKIVNLERHFNNHRGMDGDHDTLPYDVPGLQDAIAEYYTYRKWNQDGTVPESMVP